jgi:ribose transport system permease protein
VNQVSSTSNLENRITWEGDGRARELAARARPVLRRLPPLVPYGLLAFLFVLSGILIEGSLNRIALLSTVVIASLLGIAAVGQTLTTLLGGIDLSIPAVMGMAAVLTVEIYGDGRPFVVAVLIVLAVSVMVGVVNGLLSRLLRVHPLIVTLGVGSIVTGVVLLRRQGSSLEAGTATGAAPGWLTTFCAPIGETGPIPLPPVVVTWIVLTALIVLVQRRTRFGRQVYALGSNLRAAELAAVRPTLVWVLIYVLSATFACIAGILLVGVSGGANPDVAKPYLFMTVAAVVVGGTSLLGGSGGYGRTVIGALIVTQLTTIVLGLGLSNAMQQLFLGLLIVTLVMLYGRDAHVRNRI